MSYVPKLCPTIGWDQALARFDALAAALPDLAPMAACVRVVAASPYAFALYPHSSLFTLLIVQVEAYEYGRDMIEITWLPQDRLYVLQYWERPDVGPGWRRYGTDAMRLLEDLLRALGWFPTLLPRYDA